MLNAEVISVNRLSKYYNKAIGIQNISFKVHAGEIFGFLGPNGAGKTTTIRILLDLLRPSDGFVDIFGKSVENHSLEIRRRCGYLPGSFTAYIHMTGMEFLDFAAQMRHPDPVFQPNLLERFKLSGKDLSQKIKHLSHGTCRKLGIIQAFFHHPELLILDEPTTGLDPLMQEEFYDLLREFQEKGNTIFLSSHNLPEVEKVCRRVAIIRKGELVATETMENLKKKRFRKLKLTLSEPLEHIDLPDTELISQKDLHYEYLIKGEVKNILNILQNLPIKDMTLPEPELEEVFKAYYRSNHDE